MPTTPSSDNTVLVLHPTRVPGATKPVAGADYGVPKRIYDLEPMGARVDVDPYPDQQGGDTVLLNLNGQVGIDSKFTQSDSDTVTLYIPKKLLLADVVNRLTYSVVRGSDNQGTSEPPLELLYNLIRPGNQDRDPGVDGHSELELLLPDEIRNGVGPDFPDAGVSVCVSYPYCRAHDVIRLNLNGHDIYHTVTELQAPLPGSATPVQVCFNVTRADLAVGGDHAQYKISFTVTDDLGNGPDPDSPWSATQIIDVDLAGRQLVAPDLAEDPDDPSDDPSTIDLTKLGQKDLTVLVHAFAPLWRVDDEIRVTYSATPTAGPVVDHLVTAPVSRIPFTYKLMVPNAKVLPDSVVRARYELVRNNVVIATSRTAIARVIGDGAIDLRPPFLVAPATDPIDVLAYAAGVTVRVEHLAAAPDDQAQLVEVNALPGAVPFPVITINVNKRANFNLSPAFLAARQGQDIELKWVLIRGGLPTAESLALRVTVSRIADGDVRLPVPVINGNTTIELDTMQLPANAQLSVSQWLHVPNECLWLDYVGTDQNGAPTTLPDLAGTPHISPPGLIRQAPVDWLKGLKDGSELTVTLRDNFDGVANKSTAVEFPSREYKIISLPETQYETFEASPTGPIPINTPVSTSTMSVLAVSAGITLRSGGQHYGPQATGTVLFLPARGAVVITLLKAVISINYGLADSSSIVSQVIYYDEQDNVIISRNTPPFVDQRVWESYTAPAGRKIKKIRITDGGGDTYVDNFTLNYR